MKLKDFTGKSKMSKEVLVCFYYSDTVDSIFIGGKQYCWMKEYDYELLKMIHFPVTVGHDICIDLHIEKIENQNLLMPFWNLVRNCLVHVVLLLENMERSH